MTAGSTPRRIFLTGGSGFIGGEVVKLLQARGDEVRNFDIAAPHFPEQRDAWVGGDVRDGEGLAREIARFGPHVVLHLASDIDVAKTDIAEFTTTIGGTANVLAALGGAPSLRKFVHVSTQFAVRPGIEPPDERFLDPYTVYGEAKAETERMVWAAGLQVPWLILRPTIIWGPHHPSFAEQIFRHIASGAYLHPRAREPIMRAFGYVRNVAQQIVCLIDLPPDATSRKVFYLGDGTIDYDRWADAFSTALAGRRARRIPAWLLMLLGKGGDVAKALGLPAPIDSGRAFRMTTSSRIDLDQTHAMTGTPEVPFDTGVAETIAWLRGLNTPSA